jgi:hypothetical protein
MESSSVMTSFFMPTSDYDKLSEATKETLKGLYAISDEPIVASNVVKQYWTTLCDPVAPCQADNNKLLPLEDFVYDSSAGYTVLRPAALLSEIFDQQEIIQRIETHPITSVSFYGSVDSVVVEDRQSAIPNELPRGFTSIKTTIVYELEELAPLQLDYVNELFGFIWQRIYDEQEEAYDEESFNRGKPPTNSLIGQFVTGATLERHQDHCYLVLVYERFHLIKSNNKAQTSNNEEAKAMLTGPVELPVEIEILASIPMAEDDTAAISAEDQEYLTIDEDGDQAVSFAISATLKSV